MSYTIFTNSGSRWRAVIGDSLYDEHWDDFTTWISASEATYGSQHTIQTYETFLTNCENSSTGSLWFELMLSDNNGSFK